MGVPALDSARYAFLATMVGHVGLRLQKDIRVVTQPGSESIRQLAEGTIDGYLGFPPEPQELRAKKIGRVVVNSATDRPWSQAVCWPGTGSSSGGIRSPPSGRSAIQGFPEHPTPGIGGEPLAEVSVFRH